MIASSSALDAAVLTVEQMYAADRLAMAAGNSGSALMEAAGAAVAAAVLGEPRGEGCVLVLCGPGNNGGDGFVAARHLKATGVPVRLALLGDRGRLKGDALGAAEAWDGPVEALDPDRLKDVDLVVDALFGAGLDRPLSGSAAEMVRAVTAAGLPVIAVDVPSGIVGDQDQALGGLSFEAKKTITFFRKKPAHLLVPSRLYCGEVSAVAIGIPDSVLGEIRPNCFENRPALWRAAFPWRQAQAHKYQAGHALISGGEQMTGAAQLACRAALRVGAGLVTVTCSAVSLPIYAVANPSVITLALESPAEFTVALEDPRRNAVLLGPGSGVTENTRDRVLQVLQTDRAVVLDADAMTVFADRPAELLGVLQRSSGDTVLTPHDGEFARLFGDLSGNRLDRARAAAALTSATVVLKGPDTVVAAPDGRAAINASAPPWLATAGTGDVLAGMIVGLLAQEMPAFEAASAAVWLHGSAAAAFGPGMISEDLPDALPAVLQPIYDGPEHNCG